MREKFPDWIERQSLVAVGMKVLYVPAPKSGCTSVMWALAEAEGTLARPDDISELGDQSREQTIHNPRIHGLRSLSAFDDAEREEILYGTQWRRFCVTRDPYARFLSAWVNRVFLHSSRAAEWFAAGSASTASTMSLRSDVALDVGGRFRGFVEDFSATADLSDIDSHFASQHSLLRPDVFPYTDIVQLGDLTRFALTLDRTGPSDVSFRPVPRNVSLGLQPFQVFDVRTSSLIEHHYRDDFHRFAYAPQAFSPEPEPLVFSAREMALVRMVLERADRLAEVVTLKTPPRPVHDGARRALRALRKRVARRR